MSTGSRILIVAAVAVLTAFVGIFIFMSVVNSGRDGGSRSDPHITVDQAVTVALDATGVSPEDAIVSRRELTYNDDLPQYEIQFSCLDKGDTVQYIYLIDGATGDVKDINRKVFTQSSTDDEGAEDTDEYDDPDQYIGVEKVKEIILSDSGLDEDEVDFKAVKLNNKDNIMVYVAEFVSDGNDYKFFVDAVTGAVIERRLEYDDD